MAEQHTLPTLEQRRVYMRKLKTFRESLNAREQRMLDAVVLASYWPGGNPGEVQGYHLLPPITIYDDGYETPPFENMPWGKAFTGF